MGFHVKFFEYRNYKYIDTYHRVGVLKRDKARKLMTIVIYVYKNKETRDQNPLNNFLILTKDIKSNDFCKYFDCENLSVEKQCYLYLQKEVSNFHTSIDYTNATNVFEDEQEFLFNEYMSELQTSPVQQEEPVKQEEPAYQEEQEPTE